MTKHIKQKKINKCYLLLLGLVLIILAVIPITYSKYTQTIEKEVRLIIRKPNYTVVFHNEEETASQNFTYGTAQNLATNTFIKQGYFFTGWNTKEDGTGIAYSDKQEVNNLSSTEGATINLYAQWQEEVIELPEGYIECEYIVSTGTQYIDTGYKPNQDTRIIADFEYTKNDQGYRFTGEEYTNTMFRFGTSNGIWWMLGYGTQDYQKLGSSDTNRHILDFNKNNVYLDNDLLYSYNYENFTCNYNMYIFSINSNDIRDLSPTKLYSYKIYENTNLVRNFIPRLDQNGEPCLYDTVTKQTFYNQGTGTFLYKIK